MASIDTPDWVATHPAVHREDLPGEDHKPELALLRHPDYPFRARIASDPSRLFDELRDVAEQYLARVAVLDDALARAWGLVSGGHPTGFGWLPISWDGPDGTTDPISSFVVRRVDDSVGADGSVVLMAGNRSRILDSKSPRAEGLGVGLRVVLHLHRPKTGARVAVRVSGLSACKLRQAVDPGLSPRGFIDEGLLQSAWIGEILRQIARLFYLQPSTVALDGFVVAGADRFRAAGVGARDECCKTQRAFQWSTEIDIVHANNGSIASISSRRLLVEQVSEGLSEQQPVAALPMASLFLQDAASAGPPATLAERRVTRDAHRLDRLRKDAPLPALLQDPGAQPRFMVLQSVVADPENDPDEVQGVDPASLPLRSDDLAAAHAYRRAQELFEQIEAVGLDPQTYFKFARLPLRLRHRAWFARRPDGQSINAEVRPDVAGVAYLAPPDLSKRPRLEVRFGAAALRHRSVELDDHGRPSAQPLGLAADPRWAWHEFGHVLSYAATGALEFQFAHSVGDALAAVLSDPMSGLAERGNDPLRGDTFPWVGTGRRHDRDPRLGWCWCGRRNGMRHAPLSVPPLLYKGYVEEQMLSSSIFRLYQAIGGDTFDHPKMRQRAARTCAYLVLRALLLCGPASLVPVRSADAFVSALIDADIGSRAQRGSSDPTGGCLHKVVRWAFERQGLYAAAGADVDVEGPGRAPPVDLWIEDRRSVADGGYGPADLRWGGKRDWHAADAALKLVGRQLEVTVGNRGELQASSIRVRAWVAPEQGSKLDWTALAPRAIGRIRAGGRATAKIPLESGFKLPLPCYLLAEASCAADRSNLDLDTALPCAAKSPPRSRVETLDLVANDNNLGLRRLTALN